MPPSAGIGNSSHMSIEHSSRSSQGGHTFSKPHMHLQLLAKAQFLGLEHIHKDPHRVDWDGYILQREMRWIHSLRATHAPGLGEATSFKPLFYLFEFIRVISRYNVSHFVFLLFIFYVCIC